MCFFFFGGGRKTENLVVSQTIQGIKIRNGSITEVKFELVLPDVRLWWPNGLGPAHLYRLDLFVGSGNGTGQKS